MVGLNQFIIKKISDDGKTADFEVGPLPSGYGHTMGNFLRRVLLTSVPGSSITSVKIDGVQHEYSTLVGLPDDILAVILSLKNVVLVSKTHDKVRLTLDVKGKKGSVVEVKASDFEKNSDIEIINPDYVISRLTDEKSHLKMEITVERGVGYRLPNEGVRKELGVLPVDANFSPIELVTYDIVPTRVGQETELDQVNLQIRTNGSVTPVEALHVAAQILDEMTTHLVVNTEQMLTGKEITVLVGAAKIAEPIMSTEEALEPIKVVDLNLSTRLTNALLRSGYDDLRKLTGLTEEEVANIRGMGNKSLNELLAMIKKYEIKLV